MNRMKSLQRVVYGLVYPGLLGSMLYDLLNNFYPIQPAAERAPNAHLSTLVLFFYCVDYIHLELDLKRMPKGTLHVLADLAIACGLTVAYFSIATPGSIHFLPAIFGISLLIASYPTSEYCRSPYWYDVGKFVLLIATGTGIGVLVGMGVAERHSIPVTGERALILAWVGLYTALVLLPGRLDPQRRAASRLWVHV